LRTVSRDFPDSLFQKSVKLQSIYQKAIPLRPGLYRLDIVIKDVKSGNVGVINTRLQVPKFDDDTLEASSLFLLTSSNTCREARLVPGSLCSAPRKFAPSSTANFRLT